MGTFHENTRLPQFRCSRFRSSVSHSLVKLRFFYIQLFQLNDISNFDGKKSQFEAYNISFSSCQRNVIKI